MTAVYFAYDGSIHGDWVSHYAARMAAATAERSLFILHVGDARNRVVDIGDRMEHIGSECERLGVSVHPVEVPLAGDVVETIRATVPSGPETYLVCGTRNRAHRKGLLSGTVSERLLRARHCHTFVVRVMHPGLVGLPRRLLLPVSGHPRGFRSGLPFLELLQHDISHLHLLYVAPVSRWRFRRLTHDSGEHLRSSGQLYCERIERELCEHLEITPSSLDSSVVISDDVPKEIVIAANRTKSRLICLGASERNLTERFVYGNPIEQVLRNATCDVAMYRGFE